MAVADVEAVEVMITIATCSLTVIKCYKEKQRWSMTSDALLKGPGFIHQNAPFEGRTMCMTLPNQYDNTSSSSIETFRVCGLK